MKYTQDAFKNLVTGLGTNKDRSTQGEWERYVYNGSQLASAYTCSWLVQQIVNIIAEEATRKDREITTPSMTPEQRDLFLKEEKRLKVMKQMSTALRWAILFGGSGIYTIVEGDDPLEEMNVERIRQGQNIAFAAIDRNNISPESIYVSNVDSLFMLPATYTIDATGDIIDDSRFIRYDGKELPREEWETNNYWGMSMIGPILPDIERCQMVSHALAQLLDEANVDTISVEGLFAKLANATTAADIRARFAEGEIIKTLYNVQLLDSKEEYNRRELGSSITGLTQLLESFFQKPAAASGIPITKLLGVSPAGMNATGESDLENFYDKIDSIRNGVMADTLDVTDAMINQTLFGRQFDDWSYEWEPLWQASELEQSQVTSARIDSLIKLHSSGVFTSALVARQLHEDGVFNALDEDYVKDLETLEEMDEQEVEVEPVIPEETDEEDGEGSEEA